MSDEDLTLMKVLQSVKDKYYPKSETYFDEDLKRLKLLQEEERITNE